MGGRACAEAIRSSASTARRGKKLSANGSDGVSDIVRATEAPKVTRWAISRESDNTRYTIDVAMAECAINSVPAAATYRHPEYEGLIGYLAV